MDVNAMGKGSATKQARGDGWQTEFASESALQIQWDRSLLPVRLPNEMASVWLNPRSVS